VDFMDAHPRYGVLGVKIVGEDGTPQPSCRYFPTPWNFFLTASGFERFFPGTRLVDDPAWNPASLRECDWVPGCYYLVRQEVIESVGLFDLRYFLYYEEVDHCRAVRQAGWGVVYYPFTQVIHIGGESALSEGQLSLAGRQISALQVESQLLYFRKHYGVVGVLSAVILGTLTDVLKACKALVQSRDAARAAGSMQQVRTVLKVLVATRLASRATR
jgi:N-acetylglucosaminyl-diphospho-decaprenol L-rhamnosyltransferase